MRLLKVIMAKGNNFACKICKYVFAKEKGNGSVLKLNN